MRKLLPLLLLLALPLAAQPPVISGGGTKLEDADADSSVDVEVTPDADTVVVTTGGVGGATFTFSGGQLLFATDGTTAAPSIAKSTNSDLGLYVTDLASGVVINGSTMWRVNATDIRHTLSLVSDNANGPAVLNEATSITNPVILPDQGNADTGVGGDAASDLGSLIAGGSSIAQWSNDGTSNAFTLFESATQTGASFQILESDSDAMVTVGHSGLGGSGTQLLLSDANASGNTELAWTGNAGIGSEGWRAQYLNASGHLYFRPIIAGSDFVVQDSAGTVQHTLDSAGGYTLASGQLLLPDGTVGAPSLSFSGDTDLGLYTSVADQLRFATASVTTPLAVQTTSSTFQQMRSSANTGMGLTSQTPTNTTPTLRIQHDDVATGVGGDAATAADSVSLIADSREIIRAADSTTAAAAPLTCGDDATDHVCVIQGSPTQASDVFVVEDSAGTDYLVVDADADVLLGDELTWVGDEDTYLYQTAANHIALVTGTRSLAVFQNDLTFGTAAPLNCGDEGTNHRCTVQATGTQNSSIFVVEASGGTDYLSVESSGDTLLTVPHGELTEKDVDGTPTDITVTTAGTFYGWVNATAGDASGVSSDVADATADHLTIDTGMGGTYLVNLAMSFDGTNSARVQCYVFDTGVNTNIGFTRKLGTGGDVGSAAGSGIYAFAAADEVSVRCTSDGNGDVVGPWNVNLSISRIGA